MTIKLAEIMRDSLDMMTTAEYCVNCQEEVHTPDDRTGLIHKHGKYACFTYNDQGKAVRLSTVAQKG